jgi:hypothetical protein
MMMVRVGIALELNRFKLLVKRAVDCSFISIVIAIWEFIYGFTDFGSAAVW